MAAANDGQCNEPFGARVDAVKLVPSRVEDRPALEAYLHDHNALHVARGGELFDSSDHPALLAWSGDQLVGAATYVIGGADCELLTLHVSRQFKGTGSALLSAVQGIARRNDCTRLSVVTTNDNVDALRFYQRRGFRLAGLRPRAVNESRETLKPEIPASGSHGIPLETNASWRWTCPTLTRADRNIQVRRVFPPP
jgi:ribosomal protein S18 acetylase RimI-like enzyme